MHELTIEDVTVELTAEARLHIGEHPDTVMSMLMNRLAVIKAADYAIQYKELSNEAGSYMFDIAVKPKKNDNFYYVPLLMKAASLEI